MLQRPARRGRKETPEGQPKPYPRIRVHTHAATGTELPEFVYPHEVVMVRNKEDLQEALEHYGHPFPMMDGHPHPKNPHAMRHLVEWIYPALRWFCKVYGAEVPRWLRRNGVLEGIDAEDQTKIFGKEPLNIGEWHENKRHAGQRA